MDPVKDHCFPVPKIRIRLLCAGRPQSDVSVNNSLLCLSGWLTRGAEALTLRSIIDPVRGECCFFLYIRKLAKSRKSLINACVDFDALEL